MAPNGTKLLLEIDIDKAEKYSDVFNTLAKHGIQLRFGANNGACDTSIADIPEKVKQITISQVDSKPSLNDGLRAEVGSKDSDNSSPSNDERVESEIKAVGV